MIPILSNAQVRAVEEHTMRTTGVTAVDLMERAGQACADRIVQLEAEGAFAGHARYLILAGQGNNGGDGLVIARHLNAHGKDVRVLIVQHRATPSDGYRSALDRLGTGVPIDQVSAVGDMPGIKGDETIVDCLLGTGSTRPLTGSLAAVVSIVNTTGRPVVAIDLPSGTMEPGSVPASGPVIQAHYTLTFQVPRPALLFPETGAAVGRWELIPIGLDEGAPIAAERFGHWVGLPDVRKYLRARPRFGHKGSFGHALIIAGGPGCHGAALLASRGCARSGVGLLTVHGVGDTLGPIRTVLPDAITSLDRDPVAISELPELRRYTAIGFGPGMGQGPGTVKALHQLLDTWEGPIVIDADGLNVLAQDRSLLDRLPPRTILTPHPKEMDRLLDRQPPTSYERHMRTRDFAAHHRCTVILKGAYTAICAADGQAFFDPTGNAGMAKGGTGDVLTGLLAGVLAQGYGCLEASLISLFVHGLAGDIAARMLGEDAMRASDLIDQLPAAWQQLRGG